VAVKAFTQACKDTKFIDLGIPKLAFEALFDERIGHYLADCHFFTIFAALKVSPLTIYE
jgi:hypothetical protein